MHATAFLHYCHAHTMAAAMEAAALCLPSSDNLHTTETALCDNANWVSNENILTENRHLHKFLSTNLHPPGMSEKSRMHSLKPKDRRRSRNWYRMATPMHSGKEELPSNRVSHRCRILCMGNTSDKRQSLNQTLQYI